MRLAVMKRTICLKSKTLDRLIRSAGRPLHDKRASIETFADIDISHVSSDLKLDELGKARGEKEEPKHGSSLPDEIETQIVERVEAEKKKAHSVLEDEMRSYSERLANLEFEQQISAIRQAMPACISEFKAEIKTGLDDLSGPRDNYIDAYHERVAFREANRLKRAARLSSGSMMFFKAALIVLLLIVESGLNGVFLAKSSSQGLIGGVSEAIGFAFLNIGIALLFARFGVPEINHRNKLRVLFGLGSLGLYFASTVALNLALAHYRDVAEGLTTGGGQIVMQRLLERPFQLDDVMSWVLFGVGATFSIIAFLDGLFWTDPYPQYGAVQKRLEKRRIEYADTKRDLIDNLSEVRENYGEQIEEISRDLSDRRGEYDAILSHRSRLVRLFDQHQSQLEVSCNTLMNVYREANRRTRTSRAPKRFSTSYKMSRVTAIANVDGEARPEEIRKWVSDAHDLLNEENRTIHAEFEAALENYQQLDDLTLDNGASHGSK